MRISTLLFFAVFLVMMLECHGDPRRRYRYRFTRKGYRKRPSYRRRYKPSCRPYLKVDCIVSQWQTWGSCSEVCGSTGVRSRDRHVLRQARCRGKPCPSLNEVQACNRKCFNGGKPMPGYCYCPSGYNGKCCEKSHGQSYGFCSSKQDGVYGNPNDCTTFYHCAHGLTHLKHCTIGLHWNAKAKTCDWPEDAKCGKVDGGFGEWMTWSRCSATCNKGRQYRLRRCNNPSPSNGGADCHGSAMEMRDCILKHCQQGNCVWSKWCSWSKCSAACGCGSKKRSRKCSCGDGDNDKKRGYYDKKCYGKREEEIDCNCHECPGGNVNTESVGCFSDKNAPNRALPDFLAKFHGQTSAKHKISACAHLAKKLKLEYFGMQDGGECWADRKGNNDYSKHGKSSRCKDGIGGAWANNVYRID